MKAVVVLLLLALLGWTSVRLGTLYRSDRQLADRVSYWLDFVDEQSVDSVRAGLVKDAGAWQIDLRPQDIKILYQDVDRAVGPQKLLGNLAAFQNKQVGISLRYEARFLGFRYPREITRSTIRQVAIRQRVRPEYEELLR